MLEGADRASLGFNAATRQITTRSGVVYDRGMQPRHSATPRVADDDGASVGAAVTINVGKRPEAVDEPRLRAVA